MIDDLDINNEGDYRCFDDIITEITALNHLKVYLQSDSAMFNYEYMDDEDVVYVIPLETLEIWFKNGVVTKYMSYIRAEGIIPTWLTDSFFGYKSNFVTIFEKLAYEKQTT